jgi:hypothetical protein
MMLLLLIVLMFLVMLLVVTNFVPYNIGINKNCHVAYVKAFSSSSTNNYINGRNSDINHIQFMTQKTIHQQHKQKQQQQQQSSNNWKILKPQQTRQAMSSTNLEEDNIENQLQISSQSPILDNSNDNNNNNSMDERTKYLEKATQLRRDIERLEQQQQQSTSTSTTNRVLSQQQQQQQVKVEVTDIANSIWIISYRFSDEPEQDTTSDNNNNYNEEVLVRKFYSGKVTVKFRKDGYTDIISQSSVGAGTTDSTNNINTLHILKAWGWDIERGSGGGSSTDDDDNDIDYILFSLDVHLPSSSSSPTSSIIGTTKQRFYFQARQVRNNKQSSTSKTILSFEDGTITIKQDILDSNKKTPKRWGLFSPRGILVQFRSVGNFIMKPSAI